jgi:glucose uptake protein GlcU
MKSNHSKEKNFNRKKQAKLRIVVSSILLVVYVILFFLFRDGKQIIFAKYVMFFFDALFLIWNSFCIYKLLKERRTQLND